jgi:hypothetical protein
MKLNRILLGLLYLITVVAFGLLVAKGYDYYRLPTDQRPHHPLHEQWKPSGIIGHGVGIIGSALMLILLTYSLRKRTRAMQRWGDIRWWLNYHIWMGITGPLLVLLHTTFKFGGIVSISFWSMVAVALSGVLGRYIYVQIPRAGSGEELSDAELADLDESLQKRLREQYALSDAVMLQLSAVGMPAQRQGWGTLWSVFVGDLAMPFKLRSARRILAEKNLIPRHEIPSALKLVERRAKLHRRMALLSSARELLHHWHIIHRPFALVMLLIMTVHVVITVLFGYHWIF